MVGDKSDTATPKDLSQGPMRNTCHDHSSNSQLRKTQLSPSLVEMAKKQAEELKQTMARNSRMSKEKLASHLTHEALKAFMRSKVAAKDKSDRELEFYEPDPAIDSKISDSSGETDLSWKSLTREDGKIRQTALQRRHEYVRLGRHLKKLKGIYKGRKSTLFYKKAKKFTGYGMANVDYMIKYFDLVQQGEWLLQYPANLKILTGQIQYSQVMAINQDQSLKEQMEKGIVT